MDISDFVKFEEVFSDDIMDFVPLGDKIMVIYRSNQKDINTLLDGHKETHNVSIAIASAITAYARIHMSQFKITLNIIYIIRILIVFTLINLYLKI
jgi:hypothetical protein